MKFALYFGNRGFFPGELIASARQEMKDAVTTAGYDYIEMDETLTRYGAVETTEEGRKYAAFLKENEGKYDGVIICLPNFGEENGAIAALRDCGVPILIQAYPDEIGKMDFAQRRDAFCGKFSIMNMFDQAGLPFTAFEPHTVHPSSEVFQTHLKDFAAICRVVKGMRRLRIGAIGARTTAFKTVRFDEIALEKVGITVESLDLSDLLLRVKNVDPEKVKAKVKTLKAYTDFSKVPEDKTETIAKVGVAIDDIIEEYDLNSIAIRCWSEMQDFLGVAPCVLLSELNDRGIVASCEMDVSTAVSMEALALASQEPSMCLDWNNNYGDDPNKCILFHCGPVAQSLMTGKGLVTDHKMFAKSYGPGCGWGPNEGRIAAFDMTYSGAKTIDGKLVLFVGEGKFTQDEIEDGFFGCGGVVEIDELQKKLLFIGKNGFLHHVAATKGHVKTAVLEAVATYLGYEIRGL